MVSRALDLSNYDIDIVNDPARATEMVANGYTQFIMGAQRVQEATAIATTMINAGAKLVGVYCFLYFGYDVTSEVQKAIQVASAFNTKWIWMDVESTPSLENGVQTPAQRITQLWQAIRMAESAGFKVGIYTGGWYWPTAMANTTEFSSYPLWHSDYGANDGTKQPVTTVSYGGWSSVAIHQFCSAVTLSGRARDQDYIINEDLFKVEEPKSEIQILNEAITKRFNLIALASDCSESGYMRMLKAYDLLSQAGILKA